jgi:hypothetical protein
MGEDTKSRGISNIPNGYPGSKKGELRATSVMAHQTLTCSFEGALLAQMTYNSTNGTLQIGSE